MNEKNISNNEQKDLSTNSDTSDNSERPRHDELFKNVMSEPVATREFLEHYLPVSFKSKINLNSVKIEKESFVTESLRKRLSDVVYSVSLKLNNVKDSTTESVNNNKAYFYVLIEHRITGLLSDFGSICFFYVKDIKTQIKNINKKKIISSL